MASAKSLIVPSISSPLALKVESGPIPEATLGTVVVEVLASVIGPHYGHLLSTPNPALQFPTPGIYGNNAVGRVMAAGPDAAALSPGQLVYVDSYVEARDDPDVGLMVGFMNDGSPGAQKLARGPWRNGTWTTHAVVPLENATPLDEAALFGKLGYDAAELAYLTRLSVAYGGMAALGLKPGETIIVGPATGQFGGAAVEVASAFGARVIALGRNTETLARLKATVPRVETVVLSGDAEKDSEAIQAFGRADAFVDFLPTGATSVTHIGSAIRSLRRRGRVALMGAAFTEVPIPYLHVMLNSIEIKGRWMYSRKEMREVIKMVETGVLKIGKPAGHTVQGRFTLEEWQAALDAAAKYPSWGSQVVFTPQGH